MNNILLLVFEYFKIGCVAIGGGYTVIPFLYYLVEKYSWFDASEITQMIAISNLTPGPIGINMATFVGLKVGGFFAAILTTFAFMLPSFVLVCLFAKFLKNNLENKYVHNLFYGLRPAALALVCYTCLKILNSTVLNMELFRTTHKFFDLISLKAFVLLAVFCIVGLKLKKNPMLFIFLAVILGLFVRV